MLSEEGQGKQEGVPPPHGGESSSPPRARPWRCVGSCTRHPAIPGARGGDCGRHNLGSHDGRQACVRASPAHEVSRGSVGRSSLLEGPLEGPSRGAQQGLNHRQHETTSHPMRSFRVFVNTSALPVIRFSEQTGLLSSWKTRRAPGKMPCFSRGAARHRFSQQQDPNLSES